MTSNCPFSHRVKSPGKQEAINFGDGDKCTVYVYTSSPSQLSARGFCIRGSHCLPGFPEAPLARPWVAIHSATCQCGTPVEFFCQETQWSVQAVPLST